MKKKVLITGGAGFIGSHLADALLLKGYEVVVLDNLSKQVHGDLTSPPSYLSPHAQFIYGDVRDRNAVRQALKGVDAVFHYAAMVGVGQSMYEIMNYTEVNNLGTSILLEELASNPVQKLVVASSMSIYGEGWYQTEAGETKAGQERPLSQLRNGDWELYDEEGNMLSPFATPETKEPSLASIYALSKFDQEKMCLIMGRAYQMPVTALRFFNVFGTRQSLSNPYTGVLAIFASRIMNGNPPLIYEDGLQKRDFVSVYDIVQASILALESPEADYEVFNVGSGNAYTILEIADKLSAILNSPIPPEITGKYRKGDIRHCFADISKAADKIGYTPKVTLEEGLVELAEWLAGQQAVDHVMEAGRELNARGLTI